MRLSYYNLCTILTLFCVKRLNSYTVMDGPLLKERPFWLKSCQRNDPNLNDCLKNVLENIFPQLAPGIPEINVEGFEPLHLDRLAVTKNAGAVTLSGSFTNITVVGPSNSTPSYARIDIKNGKLDFGMNFPKLDIESKYDLQGKILILPLVGNGDCKMTLGGINTMVTTNISFILREGKEVLQIDTMQTRFSIKYIRVHLTNLFNGNKLLGATVNKFLNERGLEIVQELEETIGENLSEIFLEIANNLFWKLPTELWLPNNDDGKDQVSKKK